MAGLEAAGVSDDDDYPYYCVRCRMVVAYGLRSFQSHLKRVDHLPPFVCGQNGCCSEYKNRRDLYAHLRNYHSNGHSAFTPQTPVHHVQPVAGSSANDFQMDEIQWQSLLSSYQDPQVPSDVQDHQDHQDHQDPLDSQSDPNSVLPPPDMGSMGPTDNDNASNSDSDIDCDLDLEHSASLAVMSLRGISYMTGVVVQKVQEQCYILIQKTATILKKKVLTFLKSNQSDEEKEALLQSFTIPDPFRKIKSKKQQLQVFQDKFGLIPSEEINLTDPRFDVRQQAKRRRTETVQLSRSYQYVSVIEIVKSVMSDPELRRLILSEKPSDDEYMRSFLDGRLFADLPSDLKQAIRIILYVDDLEILQGLSVSAGVYKVSGIYFGIQNLPPEINALLTSIFVTALAYANDAKGPEVWQRFLQDMNILETEGAEILIDNNEPFHFKAVLIAQIGDTDAAHQLLGLGGPSCALFCRCCYVKRKDMWKDCLALGQPRTLAQHLENASLGGTAQAVRTTGVKKRPLISGLRFFNPVECSVFDCFHDILQGVAKMEVKLALRHYVHVKKYFSEETLNSRMHFFDYGWPDRKNKPSAYMTEAYISNLKNYNLHLTGSQMWCFMRAFGFLFGDLVPEYDKFMTLISLLNQISKIVFSRAISPSNLNQLSDLIEVHHKLFMEIFPDGEQAAETVGQEDEETVDEDGLLPEEIFEEVFDPDEENTASEEISQEANSNLDGNATRQSRKIRMINKHHHMLHYVQKIKQFGPLVLYMCMRYEARHYFFKLAATVSHNFINVLKTLMDMLQMKLTADKLKPTNDLVIGKRGTKVYTVCDTPHSQLLCQIGLDSMSKIFKVEAVTQAGVEYRPSLFVTLALQNGEELPQFAQIKSMYVDPIEDKVYVIAHKWKTVRFVARYCAFLVRPSDSSSVSVCDVKRFPTYRLLALWKPYNSTDVYVAPRTNA